MSFIHFSKDTFVDGLRDNIDMPFPFFFFFLYQALSEIDISYDIRKAGSCEKYRAKMRAGIRGYFYNAYYLHRFHLISLHARELFSRLSHNGIPSAE